MNSMVDRKMRRALCSLGFFGLVLLSLQAAHSISSLGEEGGRLSSPLVSGEFSGRQMGGSVSLLLFARADSSVADAPAGMAGGDIPSQPEEEMAGEGASGKEGKEEAADLGGVEQVLDALNEATSMDSPFTADPVKHTEDYLDSVDEKLKDFEKEQRLVLCFDVTQKHYMTHRKEYLHQARTSADQLEMREDEAMRLMFHGSLVACYHNLGEKDVDKYAEGRLSDQDEHRILMRHKHTPTRFSGKQMKLLEKIISTTQDASTPGFLTISGWLGQVYMGMVVFLIFSMLYFGYRQLASMRESRGRKIPKLSKMEKRESKGTSKKTK